MIPTRIHGMIDYGTAALLGSLSLLPALRPRVRQALGAASAFHAATAAITDYEAGLYAGVTMRQHLALDTAGAVALCTAGLAMRGEPNRQRALLIGSGLAEMAVIALTSKQPRSGPGQGTLAQRLAGLQARAHRHDHGHDHGMAYKPLDTLKPVADGVWIVDSVMGPGAPVRMTVIRLGNGDLLLHSPTRFTPPLRDELAGIGRIQHLVAPNVVHWTFMQAWQQAVPGATTWAAPNLRQRGQVKRSGLRIDHDLHDMPPPEWANEIRQAVVRGGAGFTEVVLFHKATRTLVLTDLVLNVEPAKLPALLRPLARAIGVTAPDGRAPVYLRAIVKLRHARARQEAARIVEWGPERVIFTHGRWFERDGEAQLRRSWRWLL